ncbi:MAG TPA: hypothetical protein VIC87_14265 [Vicinamibacteria bacterium]
MNRKRPTLPWGILALAGVLLVGSPGESQGAGPVVTQLVVSRAIESLPKPLNKFYKDHRLEIPSLALEPTFPEPSPERRFAVDKLVPFPFNELPHNEASIKTKYGEAASSVGRLPWLIQESFAKLVEAFKLGDKEKILVESDTLAGLVADLHNPLNLSVNSDGQNTGQHGLWVRFAQRLPEAMDKRLKVSPDAANFLDDPKEYVFSVINGTYVWLDNLLYLDELARRGKSGYTEIYYEDFEKKAGPVVRQLLAAAAEDAGSFWYTAWTVAGKPELK